MAIARDHELHRRRLGRNVGVAGVLVALIAVVFALSVVKITSGEPTERFDHVARPQLELEHYRQGQDAGTLPPPAPLGEAEPRPGDD